MNFRRGFQMIVHDPGLNNRHTNPPTPLTPPVAYRRWTVHAQNSPRYILERVTDVAESTQGGLDALHFMGHGSPGGIRIGASRFTAANANLFASLRGKVGVIVFFSCQVGGEHQGAGWHRGHPTYYGQRIAAATGARVVVAQENQTYSWGRSRVIDFGDWEGPVDVFESSGDRSTYQAHNPFRQERRLDLEELIFGDSAGSTSASAGGAAPIGCPVR